jgi:hypothetical protein
MIASIQIKHIHLPEWMVISNLWYMMTHFPEILIKCNSNSEHIYAHYILYYIYGLFKATGSKSGSTEPTVRCLVNTELERLQKQSWPSLNYYPSICLEGLHKTTKYKVRIDGIHVKIRSWYLQNTQSRSATYLTVLFSIESVKMSSFFACSKLKGSKEVKQFSYI